MALSREVNTFIHKTNTTRRKDKKAKILALQTWQDVDGVSHTELKEIFDNDIWCYSRMLSQDEHHKYYPDYPEARLFIFNFHPEIETGQTIEYRGKRLIITRVDSKDDYNGDIYCYAVSGKAEKNPEYAGNNYFPL